MIYAVTAQRVSVGPGGWSVSQQVPTFYLDSDVQGIRDVAHAERIARNVVGDGARVSVVEMDRCPASAR